MSRLQPNACNRSMSVFMQDAEEYVDEMGLPEEQKHTLLSQFRTKEAEGITDVEEAMRSICVDMGMPEDDARATELRASQPQICVASIPTERLHMCVRAFGALHAAAPWRTTNFDTKIEAVIAGRRYFIACDGGDGEKPTLAIYASYADAQPRNEAKQHDSYLVTFGGFFARREAQPPPETDREVCEFILGADAFDGGRAYPECAKLVAKPRRRVDTPLGPDEVGLCAAAARVYVIDVDSRASTARGAYWDDYKSAKLLFDDNPERYAVVAVEFDPDRMADNKWLQKRWNGSTKLSNKNVRHSWCIRSITEPKFSDALAARAAGHSLALHTSTYAAAIEERNMKEAATLLRRN